MTPQELHDRLQPSVVATLQSLRTVLGLHDIEVQSIEDVSAALNRVEATVGWTFVVPIGGETDIGVMIEVLRTDAMIGEDVPGNSLNFELIVSARNGDLMCAYQPCKFTTEQWVSMDDWPAVEARYALFAAFCDGCVEFVADHVRVRSAAVP